MKNFIPLSPKQTAEGLAKLNNQVATPEEPEEDRELDSEIVADAPNGGEPLDDEEIEDEENDEELNEEENL